MANPKMFLIILLASYGGFVGAMHAPHQQAKQKQIIEAGEPSKNEPSLKSKFYHVTDYILEAIPPSNGEMIAELSTYAVDYCHTVGNVALWQDPPRPIDLAIVQPISLLPSPFPRELFEKAKSIQKFVNELYFRVSLDHTFLLNAYKDLVEADPWIKRQVELMEKVRLHIEQSNDARPKMTLIFNRADYFTHQVRKGDKISLKQVEVNISQLGGPGDGNSTSDLHEQMLRKVQLLRYGKPATMASGKYPKNSSRTGMAQAMLAAWKAYMEEYEHEQLDKAVIVFLFDKELIGVVYFEELQWMQFELERLAIKEGLYVNVVRVTIPESPDRIKLNEKDGHLYLDGDRRVALVHMVVGLLPHHWEGEKVWNTRYEMEISSAILSPNIRAQLAGTKRIQQLLAQTENLQRFFGHNEKDKIVALKETFVELWGLEKDDPATEAKIKEAIANPNEFVLKAQLGGGKGNFFGEELKEMLEKMDATKRSAYTLMQRIHPIVVKNYMKKQLKMVDGEDGEMKEQPSPIATLADVNTELSFFGTYLGKADFDKNDARGQVKIFNRTDGYFVRSKLSTSDQGGINEGHGVLDSVLLFDEEKFYEDGHNQEFSDKERKQG